MSFNKNKLEEILKQYNESFTNKVYQNSNNDTDILMDLFGITPELKKENSQYWGRELGMIWEKTTKELLRNAEGFRETTFKEFGDDSPVDYFIGNLAIDTKYRVGSGDAGTLKKFKEYGRMLKEKGYEPVFLFLREDNLQAAITAATTGGWKIITGQASFDFIKDKSGLEMKKILESYGNKYLINRS